MKHASLIAQGRKEHVRPSACLGDLTPLETRRHWVHGAAEQIFHCDECRSVLGLVGDTVEWSMKADDWKNL